MVEMENSSSPMASTTHEKASAEKANIVSAQPPKKKRNLPGMPDPDAEVIALSPKALLATNRFVCEICSKGFQRDQNLQLHRRGHNLPWKLRQRTGNEVVKKRVYVCPEATCVHHDPSRALGDLTGIKKHFCRKHGEKRYTCERCSKKYAVQSDWKAHVKTCGTREYRCDCGTMFSRRDSFITHRAFCDALAQESAKSSQPMSAISNHLDGSLKIPASTNSSSSPPPQPLTPSTGVVSPVLSIQSSELLENQSGNLHQQAGSTSLCATTTTTVTGAGTGTVSNSSSNSGGNVSNSSGVFASIFAPSTSAGVSQSTRPSSPYSDLLCVMGGSERPPADPSLSLSSSLFLSNNASSLYPSTSQDHYRQYSASQQPALSATALLQKAAQMSARSSGSSFLRGLGLAISSSSDAQDNNADTNTATASQWNSIVKLETNSVASSSSLNDHLMMGPSTIFANKPTTLDLLGLGIGANEASSSGFSAFLNSMGGEFGVGGSSLHEVGSGGDSWDDLSDKKPRLL